MKFGDNLRKLRKDAGLSQEELADKVKVSRQSVSKWETGEAYPEMNNILQLCKIFNCEINSLVNDNMADLESLDEEIKMKVVKLKNEKQRRLKILSKIIYVIGNIGKIATRIGIVGVAIAMVTIPIVGANVKTIDNNHIKVFDYELKYERGKDKITFTFEDDIKEVEKYNEVRSINRVLDDVESNNLYKTIILIELVFICLEASLVVMSMSFDHMSKLFKNIHDGDTPFTIENVIHIKKMAYFMIALIILSSFGSGFSHMIIEDGIDFDIDGISIFTILILFSMTYVFEYGYEIQLDSKGKIYGDSDE